MSFFPFLQAASSSSTTGGLLHMVITFGLIFVVMYFLLFRPQSKEQKRREKLLASMKKGDKVITGSGIHGVISSVKEQTVIVKVDENTKIEFSRSAIATIVTDGAADGKEKKNEKAEAAAPSETASAAT
ncbi:MAG: preprotein translocase subunit YajC [Treponema sp.]|nr:preprotein translocase subunit YajC [Treponema sp.]